MDQTPIPPTGLTVLVDPSTPSLDVVFIHGFTGHPERTWTHKRAPNGDEPPTKMRRLKHFSPNGRSLYWPRDILPEALPHARIMTFGYDTNIRHVLGSSPTDNNVYSIAWDLLVALEGERGTESSRPLLFIAHSLGGIVVKEMLRRSYGCKLNRSHLHTVCNATRGIIFFGTPHGGSDPRGLLQRASENVIRAMGFTVNQQIVNTLLPNSERLQELRDEFAPMAHELGWLVHSFQESKGLKFLGGKKVVDDGSSCLAYPAIEITEHILSDHMDICRFSGTDDVEYRKVVRAISRISDCTHHESPNTVDSREDQPADQEQREALLEALRFDQIDARHATIKRAYTKTCEWFLDQPYFLQWRDPAYHQQHGGFLWLKGNPGTGKSTMMKYLLRHVNNGKAHGTVLSFFFNARGEALEKTTQGLYRSLLLQLLEAKPDLQAASSRLYHPRLSRPNWSLEHLKELLETAILGHSGRLTILVDALDECGEMEVRDMISFLRGVGETAADTGLEVFVCFSSRHYPHITISPGLKVTLEREQGHDDDIAKYLSKELHIGGHSKMANTIRQEVGEKAKGIFMWVVLVVQILNREYDHGQMLHALRRKLRDIPEDLHRLFETIIEKDERNRDQLLLCIQLVLFAPRPLSREELYHAILSDTDKENFLPMDADFCTPEVINRFILSASKGLAEVTRSKKPTVQFIHESVRDYLLDHCNVSRLWPDYSNNFLGLSHSALAKCCEAYLVYDIERHVPIPTHLPKASTDYAKQLRESIPSSFPFLGYAILNIFHHADYAQNSGVCQEKFLTTFPRHRWINIDNALNKHEVRKYINPTLQYVLAEFNASNLIKRATFEMREDVERFASPLLTAIAHGNDDAIEALLLRGYPDGDATILQQRCRTFISIERRKANLTCVERGVLECLVIYGNVHFVEYYLSRSSCRNTSEVFEALRYSTIHERPNVAAHLLKKFSGLIEGTDFRHLFLQNVSHPSRIRVFWQFTPGNAAQELVSPDSFCNLVAKSRHSYLLDFLVRRGAVVNSANSDGRLPLSVALELGSYQTIEVLLRLGADLPNVDPTDPGLLKCKHRARDELVSIILIGIRYGATYLVTAILSPATSHGLSVKPCEVVNKAFDDKYLYTLESVVRWADASALKASDALHKATKLREIRIVEIILENGGVPVDHVGSNELTALQDAVIYGFLGIAKVLLEHGASVGIKISPNHNTKDGGFARPGDTALHIAVRSRNEEMIRLLLSYGADPDTRDQSDGVTPYQLATRLGLNHIFDDFRKENPPAV
ncbi:hypothetical protein F4778DRAFT_185995 [Xylariomycetidae sp. FL2044]|nr:hypothetical protein F4778DRAFT_185995 [Xylariomycetidae sp. FL2044]